VVLIQFFFNTNLFWRLFIWPIYYFSFEDSSYDLFTSSVLKSLHMVYLLVQFIKTFHMAY